MLAIASYSEFFKKTPQTNIYFRILKFTSTPYKPKRVNNSFYSKSLFCICEPYRVHPATACSLHLFLWSFPNLLGKGRFSRKTSKMGCRNNGTAVSVSLCLRRFWPTNEASYLKIRNMSMLMKNEDISKSKRDMKKLKLGFCRADSGLFFRVKILVNRCWLNMWKFRPKFKKPEKKRKIARRW